MWCSDNHDLPTGYANQSNYIVPFLGQFYELLFYQHQYAGNERMVQNFKILPGGGGGVTNLGEPNFHFFIQKYRPQLVSWLCDPFMIPWIARRKEEFRKTNPDLTYLFYYPFDSEDVYEGAKETMEAVDYRVSISEFGRKLLKRETGLDSQCIPHMIDTNIFFPLTETEKANIRKQNGLEGKFVVGSVGRNQTRKMPIRLLYVFKEFAKDKDDAVLLLHTDPGDPMGNNLIDAANRLGIMNKVRFTGMRWFSGYDMPTVNMIYNTMDVHAMTTTGEGFGITTLEAMACGLPNVVTDYTSTPELLVEDGECGIPIPANDFVSGGYNTRRVLVDIPKFADALNKYYEDTELRRKHGEIARKKALKKYSHFAVLPAWQKLFQEIFQENYQVDYVKT